MDKNLNSQIGTTEIRAGRPTRSNNLMPFAPSKRLSKRYTINVRRGQEGGSVPVLRIYRDNATSP